MISNYSFVNSLVLLIGVSGLSLVVNLFHENPSEKVGRVPAELGRFGAEVRYDRQHWVSVLIRNRPRAASKFIFHCAPDNKLPHADLANSQKCRRAAAM